MKTLARRTIAAAALFIGVAGMAWADPLVFCTEEGPRGFDPARHADSHTFDASSRQIYDRLVEFAPGSTALQPGLAVRWEVSDDGLVHTFELREGVAFQSNEAFMPSRMLTADDVVFSFERQRLAEHPYHRAGGGGWAYFDAMDLGALIASVERLGERRVAFVLTRPDAGFPAKLAMDFASILSAEYADTMLAAGTPERLDEAPIGTGPFAFASATADEVTYRPFGGHWAGTPDLEGLVIRAIPDARARAGAIAGGACHVAARPARTELEALEAAGDIVIERAVGLDVGYLAFNTSQAPFDDARVRRALAMAIDRGEIVRTLFDGEAAAARSPLPPALRPTGPEEEAAGHDPAEARAMLAEAGIEGLTITIWALPVRRSYNPDGFRMAELIRADFAEVGVEAEIVSHDWPDYLRRSRAPDREGAVLFGWQGMSGDPDAYLSSPLSCTARAGGNRAQWCNRRFDALVEQARAEGDPEARQALYAEAETIFLEEAPWASIAHPMVLTAVRREVEGFVADPFGRHIFRDVTLNSD